MKKSSDNMDLLLLAIVISLVLHAVLMIFAAPKVMSQVGVTSGETKRQRRPPMAVRKFDGDPMRERVKTLNAAIAKMFYNHLGFYGENLKVAMMEYYIAP